MTRGHASHWGDICILTVLCLFFFWRDLTPLPEDRLGFAEGDFVHQHYAPARYKADRLLSSQLPLWNPNAYSGHPFLADIQSATFYPLSLLNIFLFSRQGLTYRLLELEAMLHFPLVAAFSYLLGRRLTGSRTGGMVTAITFTFSGYLTSYPLLQMAILETQAWLPLILLCLDVQATRLAAGDHRSAARWSVAAGVVLAMALLAGHPQSGLLLIYGSLVFGLFRLWPHPFTIRWQAWGWRLGALLLFVSVGLGMAAVQWLPSWEFTRLSTRAHIGFDEAGAGFTPYDLLQLVLPAVGVPVPALYVGLLPLMLIVGVLAQTLQSASNNSVSPAPRRLVIFWSGIGLLSLLLSFGKHLPVYSVFYLLVPGWNLFRQQERNVVWAILAAALLAGYGAASLGCCGDRLSSGSSTTDPTVGRPFARQVATLCFGAALVGLVLALFCFVGYQAGHKELWGSTTAFLFTTLMLALAGLTVHSRRPVLLLAVIVLDLFTVNSRHHTGPPIENPFPPQDLLSIPLADPEPFRIVNEGRLPGSYGMAYRLEDTGGVSQLQLARYRTLWHRLPTARVWQLLNVKYVLTWRSPLEVPAEVVAEEEGADSQPTYLYRLRQPAPRAWLVGNIVVETDEQRLWPHLAAPDFDPMQQVLLSAQPPQMDDSTGQCAGKVAWQSRQPERLALVVETATPCILVLSELYYPGWRATVNGDPVAILQADGVLRALPLTAGRHDVVMVFRPASVFWGIGVSITTIVAVVVGAIIDRRRKA